MDSIINNENPLYPVFFKLDALKLLIVGGGKVGFEKLFFILKNSPNARPEIVSTEFSSELKTLASQYSITLKEKDIEESDIIKADIVIAATNNRKTNQMVYDIAKRHGKIVNVADTPDLCDFYMGSIITRGDLKVAISTNGKSPTFAKRFRQMLEDILPSETHQLITNLNKIRDQLSGNFDYKVRELNSITKMLIQ